MISVKWRKFQRFGLHRSPGYVPYFIVLSPKKKKHYSIVQTIMAIGNNFFEPIVFLK